MTGRVMEDQRWHDTKKDLVPNLFGEQATNEDMLHVLGLLLTKDTMIDMKKTLYARGCPLSKIYSGG